MENFWNTFNKPIIALAPMAGVTDTAFRQLCKIWGADVIYNEFVSVDALVYENKKTREMLAFDQIEQPIVCQIFGKNPEHFVKATKIIEEAGFAGIDINFGCPAYKVVKNGGGVTLMRNLPLCYELVQAVAESTKLPISLKIRASIKREQGTKVTALDLVEKIKKLPISAIMVHARSYEQPFDGEPNLEVIKEIKKIWPGKLLANGGIYSPEKAQEVLLETQADGIGLARGAWGKPWLFRQIKQFLQTNSYKELAWQEIKQIMLKHAELAFVTRGSYGLIELRKHLGKYAKGLPNAATLRSQLVQIKTLADVINALK